MYTRCIGPMSIISVELNADTLPEMRPCSAVPCRRDPFYVSFFFIGCFFYESKPLTLFHLSQVRNEVVFWDRIVRRKEDAVIVVSGKNKYPFREVSAKFKYVASPYFRGVASTFRYPRDYCSTNMHPCRGSTPANYTLKYNLMPFVGMLTYGEAARVTDPIDFPVARERVE